MPLEPEPAKETKEAALTAFDMQGGPAGPDAFTWSGGRIPGSDVPTARVTLLAHGWFPGCKPSRNT